MSLALEPVTPHSVPLASFLEEFSESLCSTTAGQLTPLFTPEVLEAAKPVLNLFGEPLIPSQANVTAAMAHAFRYHPSVICSSEMSTGKSRMATGVAALIQAKRVLVLAPPHLVVKWGKEIRTLLPGAQTAILRNLSDVDAFSTLQNHTRWPLFAILSRERAKLSYAKRPSILEKVIHSRQDNRLETYYVYVCPQCGSRVDTKDEIPVTPRTLLPGQQCRTCQSPLWTFDPDGPRRYALADYIGKHHPRCFDLLIADEIQEFKARSSAQALAFALLLGKCRRGLSLTGTLSSGRSTSLFHLLWRMNPAIKAGFKISDEARWVDLYGTWETRTTDEQLHKVIAVGKESKRRVHVSVRERPGISPHIIPHLVSHTAFFQLKDLGMALPPYREFVEEHVLSPDLCKNYETLKLAARDLIAKGRKTRDGHLLSSTIQALLAYPDRAWMGECLTNNKGETLFTLAPLPDHLLLPKEQALLTYVAQQRRLGRRVLVFCTHTQSKDITARLNSILCKAGLRSTILPASIPPERRMQWIDDRTAEGLDALICNPKLIATGLDLIAYPSIKWYEVEYSTYLVRQASRRSWRPFIQKQAVEVSFSLYKQTFQEQAWALVAAGIKSALQTEGDLTSEGLSDYQQTDDLMTQLIRQVLDRNATVLSAETMFAELAALYTIDQRQSDKPVLADTVYPPNPEDILIPETLIPTPRRGKTTSTLQLSLFGA